MKTQLLKTRAGEMSVTEAGEGIPLLAFHGALSSGISFTPLLEHPPQGCHLIAVDLPGHGRSPSVEGRLDGWGELSRRVFAAMEALELHDVHLMGHSMGGGICAYAAGERPELVKGLILIDSVTMPFSMPLKGRIPLIPVLGELVFRHVYGEAMFLSYFRNNVFFDGGKLNKDRILAYYQGFDSHRESALQALRATADPRPVQDRLSKISCPTLVVWGAGDPLIPVDVGERTVAQIPQATFERIESCGHAPFDEAPEDVCRIVTAFWETVLLPRCV